MIIGIPRAGYYFKFRELWESFFKELDIDIIISPETNKEIFDTGIKESSTEMCQPLKIFVGHVSYLRNKVDRVFIPDILGDHIEGKDVKENFCCPFFMGISDLIKSVFPDINFISCDIRINENNKEEFVKLGKKLGKSKNKCSEAYDKALENYKNSLELHQKQYNKIVDNKKKKLIALVAIDYVLEESFCNMGIKEKLKKLNCDVLDSTMLNSEYAKTKAAEISELFHWAEERHLSGALLEFIENKDIDGIVFILPFSCGPNFLLDENIIKKYPDKHVLVLNVDEASADAMVQTRLEAFVDMLK